MEKHKKIYKRAINEYGFLPLLYVMRFHEIFENYEQCQIIKEVIDEFNKEFGINHPTILNEKAVETYVSAFEQFGLSGYTALHNCPNYAQEVIDKIQKLDKCKVSKRFQAKTF